eukprot:Hpha_TRINITY_DN3915_c0_g1::TRINITY_DN3915_c0_g1_i2::g.18129::m.18129
MPFGIGHKLMGGVEKLTGQDLDGDGVVGECSREHLISNAFREALGEGVERAVEIGSAPRGYLDDHEIHIPWPDRVVKVRHALQKVGQDDVAVKVRHALQKVGQDDVAV